MNHDKTSSRYTIATDLTDDEVIEFQNGPEAYNMAKSNGEFDLFHHRT